MKKVPGTLHFLAKSPGHSFDFMAMNMSHVVHQWFFGNKPSPRRRQVHPVAPTDATCAAAGCTSHAVTENVRLTRARSGAAIWRQAQHEYI